MRFAWHVAKRERGAPNWSQQTYFKLRNVATREQTVPDAAMKHEDETCEWYGHIFVCLGRFDLRIADDLANLRASWTAAKAPGPLRLAIFDRVVTSRFVSLVPSPPNNGGGGGGGLQFCDFTGLPTTDSAVFSFGHKPTDRVEPLRARVDRHVFFGVVRPILIYAHFVSHMATHTDALYGNMNEDQKLDAFARELAELRRLVAALTLTRACDRERETLASYT